MPTYGTTTLGLRYLTGTNPISDIDAGFQALAEDVDAKLAAARTIRGGVDAGGTPYVGTGFTATHGGTGIFTVLFTTVFGAVPVVVAMATEVGYYVSAFSVASSQASLRVRTDAGVLIDAPFMFIAMKA